MKRILKSGPVKAAALLCMGMLAMSGCQEPPTPAGLLQEVSENMASVGSYAANMLVEMEVTGEIMEGQTSTIGVNVDMDIESTKEPSAVYMGGSVGISMVGVNLSVDIENYTIKENDGYVSYTNVNEQWVKESVESENTGAGITAFKDLAGDEGAFLLSEDKAVVNDQKCYELKGTFDADKLLDILNSAGNAADRVGGMTGEVEFGEAKIPVRICVYEKTRLPALMEIDLTKTMQAYIAGVTDEASLDDLKLIITYHSFNDVEEIIIPSQAKKAVEETRSNELGVSDLERILGGGTWPETEGSEEGAQTEEAWGGQSSIETAPPPTEGRTGWQTYEVSFNGRRMELPFKVSELEAMGYTYGDYMDSEYVINKGQYEYGFMLEPGGAELSVFFLNRTDGPLALKDCEIGGLQTNNWSGEPGGVKIVFPQGIKLGSGLDEVLEAYGNPQDVYDYEEDSWISLYYYSDSDNYMNSVDITVDRETQKVIGLNISKLDQAF